MGEKLTYLEGFAKIKMGKIGGPTVSLSFKDLTGMFGIQWS